MNCILIDVIPITIEKNRKIQVKKETVLHRQYIEIVKFACKQARSDNSESFAIVAPVEYKI